MLSVKIVKWPLHSMMGGAIRVLSYRMGWEMPIGSAACRMVNRGLRLPSTMPTLRAEIWDRK